MFESDTDVNPWHIEVHKITVERKSTRLRKRQAVFDLLLTIVNNPNL